MIKQGEVTDWSKQKKLLDEGMEARRKELFGETGSSSMAGRSGACRDSVKRKDWRKKLNLN